MTPEERAFLEDVQRRTHQLAALFGAVRQENGKGNSGIVQLIADKGGLLALELCGLAGDRISAVDMQPEGYDLTALATAPPSVIEE